MLSYSSFFFLPWGWQGVDLSKAKTNKTTEAREAATIHTELMNLYRQHAPKMLPKVRVLLQKYKGNERELLDKVRAKYTSGAVGAGKATNASACAAEVGALDESVDMQPALHVMGLTDKTNTGKPTPADIKGRLVQKREKLAVLKQQKVSMNAKHAQENAELASNVSKFSGAGTSDANTQRA